MKDHKEPDIFKEAMRRKLAERPVFSGTDEELWNKVVGEIAENGKEEKGKQYFLWYAAAASILVCLIAGIYLWNTSNSRSLLTQHPIEKGGNSGNEIPKTNEMIAADTSSGEGKEKQKEEPSSGQKLPKLLSPDFSTAIALYAGKEVLNKSLTDGSMVTVNEGSTVRVSQNFDKSRDLELDGEAYFEVKLDKSRPFRVYFDNYYLEVVGTKFNIRNLKEEDLREVSVTEGIVRVYVQGIDEGIEVQKGEQLKFYQGREPELVKVDAEHFIAWKTGNLRFKNTPLEEVCIIIERRFNQKIHLENSIKSCKFTGDLSDLNFDEALQVVGMTTSLKIEKAKDKVSISGSGCH